MMKFYKRRRDFIPLSHRRLLRALKKEGVTALDVIYYRSVGSTNTEAKLLAGKKSTPTLLVAEGQTGGRGRMGKSFSCPDGAGVYMSLLLYPDMTASDCTEITALAAVAVARVLKRLTGLSPWIKWVNDIYIGEKKLSGILTEGSVYEKDGRIAYAVIGIGLNVWDTDLGALSDIATSIEGAGGRGTNRAKLIAAITAELLSCIDTRVNAGLTREYLSLCRMNGLTVRVSRGKDSYLANVISVNPDLSLTVTKEDGETDILSSGDVSVHPYRID